LGSDSRRRPSNNLPDVNDQLKDDARTRDSYFSEWSSNYTMSNLPCPGRLLGNLYSLAGSALERNLERLVYRVRYRSFVKAEKALRWGRLVLAEEMKKTEREDMCGLFLTYARSKAPAIQTLAFRAIIHQVVRWPSLRHTFEAYSGARGEPIEAAISSWKRPDVNYKPIWIYLYHVASLCLTSNHVMDYFHRIDSTTSDMRFPLFEGLLTSCRDNYDTALALDAIGMNYDHASLRTQPLWTTLDPSTDY